MEEPYACPHCGGELPPDTLRRVGRRGRVPAEVVVHLRALRQDRDRLNWYMRQLHEVSGYSLGAIAEPIGVTRERVRQRIVNAHPVDGVPRVEPPLVREPPPPPTPPPPVVTDEIAAELAELHKMATLFRGGHSDDHPYRRASVELTQRLAELQAAGATYAELGTAIGITKHGVRARLSGHGYKRRPPSRKRLRVAAGPLSDAT